MQITADMLQSGSYKIYDIRSADDRVYGFIPGSVSVSAADLLASAARTQGENGDKGEKIVVYCARGLLSREVAEKLCELGLEAYSLEGGYAAWLCFSVGKQTAESVRDKAEQSLVKRFRTTITSRFNKALKDYELIESGDRIAVCISGGKDSMLMAKLFKGLKRYTNVDFEVEYVVMDPGYNRENRLIIEKNAEILGIPIRIFETNIFSSVFNIEKNPCYVCARMRRGYLYSYAKSLGCNKIALGHHYDDVIETILMGLLNSGQFQSMMPKLRSTNFEGMELIRPLYLVREDDIKAWRDYNGLHFLQCACKFTEQSAQKGESGVRSMRLETKKLIKELKKINPDVEKCIFKSSENVNLDTLLGYKKDGVRHGFLEDY